MLIVYINYDYEENEIGYFLILVRTLAFHLKVMNNKLFLSNFLVINKYEVYDGGRDVRDFDTGSLVIVNLS